jgi:hypothetical protein
MQGVRITEEQRKQILYHHHILHESQRRIARILGLGKTAVQRVIAKSKRQSIQNAAKPNTQIQMGGISNYQRREKAKVRRPTSSWSGMSFAPQSYSKAVRPSPTSSESGMSFAPHSYSKAASPTPASSESGMDFSQQEYDFSPEQKAAVRRMLGIPW